MSTAGIAASTPRSGGTFHGTHSAPFTESGRGSHARRAGTPQTGTATAMKLMNRDRDRTVRMTQPITTKTAVMNPPEGRLKSSGNVFTASLRTGDDQRERR